MFDAAQRTRGGPHVCGEAHHSTSEGSNGTSRATAAEAAGSRPDLQERASGPRDADAKLALGAAGIRRRLPRDQRAVGSRCRRRWPRRVRRRWQQLLGTCVLEGGGQPGRVDGQRRGGGPGGRDEPTGTPRDVPGQGATEPLGADGAVPVFRDHIVGAAGSDGQIRCPGDEVLDPPVHRWPVQRSYEVSGVLPLPAQPVPAPDPYRDHARQLLPASDHEEGRPEFAYTPTNCSWLNRIEAQFTALRYFALDGTDHASHREQGSMIRRYIIWRNKNAAAKRLREIVDRANVA